MFVALKLKVLLNKYRECTTIGVKVGKLETLEKPARIIFRKKSLNNTKSAQ